MTTAMRKYVLTFLFFLLFGIQNSLVSIEYGVADLGTLETDFSQAFCINDKGQVCGWYIFQNEENFFIWDPDKGISCLDLPKDMGVIPLKMNNRGQIVGNLKKNDPGCYGGIRYDGFLWDPTTGFVNIGGLGGNYTQVKDINDLGQVVGCAEIGAGKDREIHAFLWENGFMTDLGTLCGDLCFHGTDSCAMGINNEGVIVGYSNHAILHKGKKQLTKPKAVIWENGHIRQLDIPGNEIYHESKVCAVNNLMQIIYMHDNNSYLRDLSSGKDFKLHNSQLEKSKITDSNALLNLHWVMLDCTDKNSKNYRNTPNPSLKNSIWKQIAYHTDVNNAGWVIGAAETIYGEHHAILLRPVHSQD